MPTAKKKLNPYEQGLSSLFTIKEKPCNITIKTECDNPGDKIGQRMSVFCVVISQVVLGETIAD